MNFDTWGIVSAAVLASVLSYVLLFRHRLARRLRFSGLQLFTGGLYGAILILLMPIMHDAEVWQDLPVLPWLRALLLSVPEAVRFFLLEGDFKVVEEALSADGTPASLALRVYGTCLYFLAPMMTFGNVLSLFSGTIARLRLCFSIRPVAAFSALNEASLTLAESIYREKRKQILGRPLIAFVGVSGEQDDELRRRVREFGGIILKHDPVRLAISVFNRPIEFFLLSEQEEENVELGLRLAKRYKEGKRKVSVFVFASSENADMLLDNSAKSDRVLGKAFRDKILNFPQEILYQNALKAENCEIYGNFSLRCVDPARALAMDVLTGRNYADYEAIFAAAESDRTISVLMLGMNAEGAEFLKTAAWFYQRYGYRVCFHVFCGKDDLWSEERLRRKCPDLFQTFDPTSGDACHDIRFFADLDKLFEPTDLEELRRIKLAFISLGDDGKNVDTAIALRSLFDRIHGEKRENSKRQPIPYIYCVVRSDSRADSLRAGEGLRNYKGEHFHIDFVGAFSEQYSYDRIRRIRQTEADGFYYHLDWTRKESLLRRHYELSVRENTDGNFVAEIAAEMARGGFAWNDGAYFTDDTRTVVKAEKLKQEAEKYMNESYCRRSSIAKLEHKAAVTRFYPDTLAHSPVCGCDACREMRITEHMRWNAYMRGLGYRRADARYDRAMVHNDLKPWGELPCRERYKD